MTGPSRREFIKKASAAALGATLQPLRGVGPGRAAYEAAVLAEPSLLGFWRLDGDLNSARGSAPGAERGGAAAYAPGPLGGQALKCDPGRFVTMGKRPELDAPQASVELFFQLTAPPPSSYNPCLIARRSSSPDACFSLHVWSDLTSLGLWNGLTVVQFAPSDGPVQVGRWYHLVVTSDGKASSAYIDGVACKILQGGAPFNTALKERPLVIGASSETGEEGCACAVADAALYGSALPAAAVARHLDAAGWGEKRKRLEREKVRRDAERKRVRQEKLRRRLHDPRLMAQGATRIYEGEHLTAIRFGLGGIGAGSLQMDGRGERAAWQIFNNFDSRLIPDSFFAVSATEAGGATVTRALQTTKVGPFPAMKSLKFRGEYPFAWYDFEDKELPIRVGMEVYTPFIPLDERASSMPCAIFNLTAENRGEREAVVSFLAAQQNAVGYTGEGPILERRGRGYGGNRNRAASEENSGAAILHFTTDRDRNAPEYGDMALAMVPPDHETTLTPLTSWSDMKTLLLFQEGSGADPATEAGPSPVGETLNGALVARLRLKPGEKRTIRCVLAWHFPNAKHGDPGAGWVHNGNRYAAWYSDALAVAKEAIGSFGAKAADSNQSGGLKALEEDARLYHETFYQSNLPHWLLDRIGSQTAILRSKTCFWSADDYFGAWEGCNPGSGCCTGTCTHVWHYAQSHARLFPALGRKMREGSFQLQHPDGGLPHRHINTFPAADGQFGEILGVYREHLMSADGKWLEQVWPGVKKAMEYAVRQWDADEDGVPDGPQWNTLDGALGGSTTWIGGLYLSALAACEKMAALRGEPETAARYRRIRLSGAAKQNETLWNGEYYIQIRDPQPHSDYGEGCEIDQMLGEWWAHQVGLDGSFPVERVRSALGALLTHNFQPDFHGVIQAPRKFVADDDPGMQMIAWPRAPRPVPAILYGDEVMSGFEYSAAGAMIQQGMLKEGLMTALAASDRYDGRLRTDLTPGEYNSWGYSGNPFGDDECGKYYARAMSVWSLLLACQGFLYDGPAGLIGFNPIWKPQNHRSFFTAAEGWGLFTQRRSGARQSARIELRRGRLRLQQLVFYVPDVWPVPSAQVKVAGKSIPARHTVAQGRVTLDLQEETVLHDGQALETMLG